MTVGLGENAVDYTVAWDLQKQIHREVVGGSRPNTLLLLEHPSVYTAGKRTEDFERPQDGTPVIDVDRGGKITWHGPGQLVGYPIVRLSEPLDVVAFVRTLEGTLIDVLGSVGVIGERVEGRSGVWVSHEGRHNKIAAIGIRVSEGVSMHGFSLNCNNSLDAYRNIVACGIANAGTTTITQELGREIAPSDMVPIISEAFERQFAGTRVN